MSSTIETYHYIYFSDDDSIIGAGTFIGDKEGLNTEVNGAIGQFRDSGKAKNFVTIVSETVDFLTESKEYDDAQEYLKVVMNRLKFVEVE